MTDKMRESFEAWFINHARAPIDPFHREFGFCVWQAARESLQAGIDEAYCYIKFLEDRLDGIHSMLPDFFQVQVSGDASSIREVMDRLRLIEMCTTPSCIYAEAVKDYGLIKRAQCYNVTLPTPVLRPPRSAKHDEAGKEGE